MPETHRIDHLFRDALRDAAATPPPHVRAAVLSAARNRRRRALWWRTGAVGVGLLLGLGGGISLLLRDDVPRATTSVSAPMEPTVSLLPSTEPLNGNTPKSDSPSAQPTHSNTAQATATIPVTRASGQTNAPRSQDTGSGRPSMRSSSDIAKASEEAHADQALVPASAPAQASAPTSAVSEFTLSPSARESLTRLEPHTLDRARTEPQLRTQTVHDDYYALRGRWWVGFAVTPQWTTLRWSGPEERLARALNDAGGPVGGVSFGAWGGRAWPNGMRLGMGAELSRSAQSYRYVEREPEVVVETVTNMVTLNSLVVLSTTDTILRTVAREDDLRGQDQRTTVSIPLEVGWSKPFGRWRVGPRLGLVGSRTWVRSRSSLVQDPASARLSSRQLSAAELEQRYPMTLSALAGIDIGYGVHEHWTIMASPFLSRSAWVLGDATVTHAEPDRLGLRLMICHTL